MDDLGFVEAVNGLGESIVVAVADAADRGLDARRGKPLGIFDRDVLHTAIAVVDEAAAADGPGLVQGLLQRVQHKAGVWPTGGFAGSGSTVRCPTTRPSRRTATAAFVRATCCGVCSRSCGSAASPRGWSVAKREQDLAQQHHVP
jgi:hypothetical protein